MLRPTGLEPPFVGRDRELRLIKELLDSSAEEKRAHLLSVVGVAAIGKSRLSWELVKYVVQWADAEMLDFIEYLLDWSRSHALLLVTLARPELSDKRPDRAVRRSVTSLYLEPLAPHAYPSSDRNPLPGAACGGPRAWVSSGGRFQVCRGHVPRNRRGLLDGCNAH